MQARFLSGALFLLGTALLLNSHVLRAQENTDRASQAESAGQGGSISAPQTQPGTVAAGKLQVPDFTLKDQDGKQVTLSSHAGKIIVLEWINPECPYVQRHYQAKTMQSLVEKYGDKGVVWLAINSTNTATPKANKAWADKYDLDYPILDDSGGKVGQQYKAKTTPHMYIIDRTGQLVYSGAIDNDPSGRKDDAVNHVDQVLEKLTSGQKVELEETKPYGCSVKYAKPAAQGASR